MKRKPKTKRRPSRSNRVSGFASEFERDVDKTLKKAKLKAVYEPFELPYILEKAYTPDWTIGDIILEAKGVLFYEDREKMLAIKRSYPDFRIIFVFMKPHRRIPRLKSTHAQWAEKNGFEWTSIEDLTECLKSI